MPIAWTKQINNLDEDPLYGPINAMEDRSPFNGCWQVSGITSVAAPTTYDVPSNGRIFAGWEP